MGEGAPKMAQDTEGTSGVGQGRSHTAFIHVGLDYWSSEACYVENELSRCSYSVNPEYSQMKMCTRVGTIEFDDHRLGALPFQKSVPSSTVSIVVSKPLRWYLLQETISIVPSSTASLSRSLNGLVTDHHSY